MSTTEINNIKLNLVSWINQLSDTELISFLEGIRTSQQSNDWYSELAESSKNQIIAGINDADNGKIIDSVNFWQKLSEFK